MVTSKEIFLASLVGEECVRDAKLWEAQDSLALLVESRFPGLIDTATIESFTDRDQIREIFRAVAKAPTVDDARTAVDQILKPR